MANEYTTNMEELQRQAESALDRAEAETDPEAQMELYRAASGFLNAHDQFDEEYQSLMQNQMSGGEKFVVGAGKMAVRAGQAVKQTGLMLRDNVTGRNEAEEYTNKLNEEEALWHRQFPNVGWQTTGQATPALALAFMVPEAAGALRGGMAGALEESILSPTEQATWEAKARSAGGGALVGSTLGGLTGAKVDPKHMTPQTKRALTSDPNRLFSPSELAPNSLVLNRLNKFSMGARQRVLEGIEGGRQNLENMTNMFRQGDNNAFVMMQDEIGVINKNTSELYDDVYARIGDEEVDIGSLQQTVASRLKSKVDEGGEGLTDIQKAWEMVSSPDMLPKPPYTLRKMRKFRTKLREKNESWWKNRDEGGVSPENMDIIYDTLSEEITEAAKRSGDPEAAKWLDEANRATVYVNQKQDFVDNIKSNKAAASKLNTMGEEEVLEFVKPMSQAERNQLVSDVLESAEMTGRGGTRTGDFNPLTAANDLVTYRNNLAKIMEPKQVEELDGVIDYLRTTGDAFKNSDNPSRGFGLLAMSGAGQAAVGGALAGGWWGAGVGAGVGFAMLPVLMRNRTFKDLARQLNAAPKSRKQYIATMMNRIVEREARIMANQIDVEKQDDWKQKATNRAYEAYGKSTKELLNLDRKGREKGMELAERGGAAIESGVRSVEDTAAALMAEPPPDYLTKADLLDRESPNVVEQQQQGVSDRVKMKNTHRLHTYNSWANTREIIKRRKALNKKKEKK